MAREAAQALGPITRSGGPAGKLDDSHPMDIRLRAAQAEHIAFASLVFRNDALDHRAFVRMGIRPVRNRTLLGFSSSMRSKSLLPTRAILAGFKSGTAR
jgi:hypothetical protein